MRSATFLDEKPAVAHERLTVHLDRAAFAKITNQIPVNGRLIGAPRLRISGAKRHVHCATDLLVKEDILGERRDVEVRPECKLAERAGASVSIEGLQQKSLTAARRRIDDTSALEAQAHIMDLPAIDDHRE